MGGGDWGLWFRFLLIDRAQNLLSKYVQINRENFESIKKNTNYEENGMSLFGDGRILTEMG